MEQTISERRFSQEKHISKLQTWHNGNVVRNGGYFQQDPSQSRYPRKWTGWSGVHMPNGSCGGDNPRQVKGENFTCRDFIRGSCTRGASCKFQHSESDKYGGSRVYWNANSGKSQFDGANNDDDLRNRSFSRYRRSKSPCRKFLNGKCYRGESCPYLHSDLAEYNRPRYDRDMQPQEGVASTSRNSSFGEGKMGNTLWASQEHDGANNGDDLRTRTFFGNCRSKSPCRKFLTGRCYRGIHCPYLHPELTKCDRPWYDRRTQQHQGISGNTVHGEGSVDITLKMSQVHDGARKDNDLRTRSFSREPRRRSPCRKFLNGRCFHGASCRYLHSELTMCDRPGDDWSRQHHQGVASTSKTHGFDEGSADMMLRASQEHDEVKTHGVQLCQDIHGGSNFSVNDVSVGEQNKAWSLKDAMQSAFSRNNMDVISSNSSSERQRSRPTGEFGVDKLRREVCLKFSRGRCDRGESCKYLHGFHEYARSISDRGEQPRVEATEASRNCSGANQYATTMISQEHNHVKSESMCLSQFNHAGCSLRSTDGYFNEKIKGQFADDAVKPNIPGQMVEALVHDEHKCKNSREGIAIDCNFPQGNEDVSLWSRPFKRRRSRSRSPFTLSDYMGCRKLKRVDTQINFPIGRCYNVAPFRYQYRYSYKYDRSRYQYHLNNQQNSGVAACSVNPCAVEVNKDVIAATSVKSCSDEVNKDVLATTLVNPSFDEVNKGAVAATSVNPCSDEVDKDVLATTLVNPSSDEVNKGVVAATSVNPCSDEVNRDLHLTVPQGHEEVASHGMHIDQFPSGSHDTAVLKEKTEAESPSNAAQCSHVDQDDEASVTDSDTSEISNGSNAIDPEVVESHSVNACDKQLSSPLDAIMSEINQDDNVEVSTNLGKEGNAETDEVKEMVKTPSKKKRKKRRSRSSKCCVETTKEEVTNASVQDSDHSIQKLEQENRFETEKIQSNVESSKAILADGTLLVSNTDSQSMETSQSSSKAVIPISRRKLLVLDINGLLADIVAVADVPNGYKPNTVVSGKAVFKRPFCDDFLQFCFERFDIGVWSSRTKKNVNRVVDFLMKNVKERLLFCWDQSHCTDTGYKTMENKDKPLVLKQLKKLWDKQGIDLPWEKGFYNEANTVLLDDSPYKALRNPPFTAIFPHPYSFRHSKDKSLGPSGDLRMYLEKLSAAENVPKFIEENPFGQRPITKSNLSWGFYSKIVGTYTYGSQQEGNTNSTPASS